MLLVTFVPLCASYYVNSFVLSSGVTPLIRASMQGHLSVVRCLLEHKANMEAKDNSGMCFEFCNRNLSGFYEHGGRNVYS